MQKYTIGRSHSSDIVIPGEKVSKSHARLEVYDDGSMIMYDVSTNGTEVNGSFYHNKSFRVNRGDAVIFADEAHLDWNRIPHPKKDRIGGMLKDWKIIVPLLLLAVTGALAWYLLSNREMTSSEIYAQNKSNVGMIVHGYIFKLTAGGRPFAYMGIDPSTYELTAVLPKDKLPSNIAPFLATGTGFFVRGKEAKPGTVITNRHVAFPEYAFNAKNQAFVQNKDEQTAMRKILTQLANKFLADNNLQNETIEWTTEQAFLGIVPHSDFFSIDKGLNYPERVDRFKELCSDYSCQRINFMEHQKIDLAVIRTERRNMPPNSNGVNLDNNCVKDAESINSTDKITMIGFPQFGEEFNPSKNAERDFSVNARVLTGAVTSDPTEFHFEHNAITTGGASGSPLFNSRGKLIGVNYSGYKSDEINYAVFGSYIQELLELRPL